MITDENQINDILRNAKFSMEVEGFTIDPELEDVGRRILTGELDIEEYTREYIRQYKSGVDKVQIQSAKIAL